MRKEDLFAAIGGADEELLQRSQQAKKRSSLWKWGALAACLGLVITAVLFLRPAAPSGQQLESGPAASAQQTETTVLPDDQWTLNFVQRDFNVNHSHIATNPVFAQRDLTADEMERFLPDQRPAWMQGTGYASFGQEQELLYIKMDLEVPLDDETLWISISKKYSTGCVVYDSEWSVCNGVKFAVYEYPVTKDYVALEAVAQIDGYWFYFRIWVWPEDVEQIKPDFKDMLESFTAYAHGEKLGWEDITAEGVIPEQDRQLTWEEAVLDPDFGSYARLTAPEGAQTDATRYIGFRSDYLELHWKKGESELQWTVSHFDRKQHSGRMSSVFDIYRYGNGTGLLFEAEDITKELVTRSVLTSRKRISFGIRYEGFLIEIRGESVDRTWLWEQLVAIGIVAAEEDTDYTFTEISGIDMLAMYEDEPLGRYAPRMESFIGWSVWKYESEQKSYLELTRSWFPEDPQYLTIQITAFADESKLVRPDEREKYDLSTHSTGPWDPDIPEQYSGIMPRPVFEASEITPDMVRSRVYYNQADRTAPRMEFGVRYGDVVVYVFSIGLSPDEIYNYIQSISPEEP